MDAVAFFHRVDRDDVGMVELGKDLRLATKACQPLVIVCHFGGKHLERYIAAELRVGGAIHFTHAACAQRRLDFIRTDFGSGDEGHKAVVIIRTATGTGKGGH